MGHAALVIVAILLALALSSINGLIHGEDDVSHGDFIHRTHQAVSPSGTANAADQFITS